MCSLVNVAIMHVMSVDCHVITTDFVENTRKSNSYSISILSHVKYYSVISRNFVICSILTQKKKSVFIHIVN